jgi:acetate kinase
MVLQGLKPCFPPRPMVSRVPPLMSLILVINSGSSSLKCSLHDLSAETVVAHGIAEALGGPGAELRFSARDREMVAIPLPGGGHEAALNAILEQLGGHLPDGIGHRVVHGGENFSASVRIDEAALAAIEECSPLAPLHNPANVLGIRAARARFPDLPHVAVFDTAFHQSLPRHAYLYALPYEYYTRHHVRRYGFHGTSHRYVADEAARLLGRPPQDLQLLTAHLGNGCSACAVRGGLSADTTMGFTPLEGLVMGTRCGDIDPNLHDFLARTLGKSLAEIMEILNRGSGLLGISGLSNDMRTLAQAAAGGHERAALAIEVFCYRLAKGLLGLCAALDRVDALVFTGGIGENSAGVRTRTLEHLGILRPVTDSARNADHGRASAGRISADGSPLDVLVVPTNEELVIARETAALIR